MIDVKGIKDTKLNELILKDDELVNNILATILSSNEGQDKFSYNNYEFNLTLIESNHNGIKDKLLDLLKDILCNDFIDDTITYYSDMMTYEAKNIIHSLSRLLLLQDKFKNSSMGQDIDKTIKEWLDYIKNTDDKELIQELQNNVSSETIRKYNAYSFKKIIPQANYNIYNNKEYGKTFLDLFNNGETTVTQIKKSFKDLILLLERDAQTYNRYSEKIIHSFINSTENNIQLSLFLDSYEKDITELKNKVDNNTLEHHAKIGIKNSVGLFELKDKGVNVSNELKDYLESDEYLNELYKLYQEYQDTDEYKKTEQTQDDIIKWHEKADKVINEIETLKKEPSKEELDLNFLLDRLAYSDYQKKAYRITTEKRKLNAKELKEKYKDITRLNGEQLNYNRKWARVDTSKNNTIVYDLRESVAKQVQSKPNMTRKKIQDLENKKKPTKEDLEKKKELQELLKTQEQERENKVKELQELKDDIALIDKQIADTQDIKQVKSLTRKRNKMAKQVREQEKLLNDEGIYLQADLIKDKLLVAQKVLPKTQETYSLMISNDYDLQNFNSEGRNFLYYVPNIPNIINDLDKDFIDIDIDDFLDFTGRPNGNKYRIRNNLHNSLKEMRKEYYDYTYLDDKGVYHDDSLVLIGDIKSTEYKGKATVKVQLGATFKDNLKQAFTKSQYIKVNSDVFKIGQGRNNKAENMAKEIFLYLAKLCRSEAKNQSNTGKWEKAIHLETIIKKLCDLNLINYNPYRYNETVKEPLLYALNTGQELGYFEYQTDAFTYYDDVIASNNNGAKIQDKIENFEKGKQYGIRFRINGGAIDLESNKKAHDTYKANKKKYERKATKK